MKNEKIKLVEQVARQEVVYDFEHESNRIRLIRYMGDGGKWGEWFIDTEHEIDKLKDILTERDIKVISMAFKKVKKDYDYK